MLHKAFDSFVAVSGVNLLFSSVDGVELLDPRVDIEEMFVVSVDGVDLHFGNVDEEVIAKAISSLGLGSNLPVIVPSKKPTISSTNSFGCSYMTS